MKKTVRWIIAIAACLVLAGIAVPIIRKFANMKSEYVTASVIQATQRYVEETEGQWPKSWRDVGETDFSRYTRMNFNLDPRQATREDVMSAIQPKNGRYYTYPHAREDLGRLYERVRMYRNRASEARDSADVE